MSATLDRTECAILLIDYQELLFNAMPEALRDANLHQATILLRAARVLSLPVVVTEQYPRGLGPTLGPLRGACEDMRPYPKLEFSAASGFWSVVDNDSANGTHVNGERLPSGGRAELRDVLKSTSASPEEKEAALRALLA